MNLPYGDPVTRRRAPLIPDDYSGEPEELDWANAVDTLIGVCAFDPGGSDEPTSDARSSVVTQPSALFPGQWPDVKATDRLIIRDREWQVDGDPADYRSPFTGFGGLQVRLKAVEG